MDTRGSYKHVYRNRNVDFFVKSKHVRVRETKERAEYYKKIKDTCGLSGVISFSGMNGKNLFYDIYRENELFFENLPEGTAKNIRAQEYFKLLKENVMNFAHMEEYPNHLMIFNLEDWEAHLRESSNQSFDNPVNLFYYGMKKELELFRSALGNFTVILMTSNAVMKFQPKDCTEDSYKKFFTQVNKLSKTVIEPENVSDTAIDMMDDAIRTQAGSTKKVPNQDDKQSIVSLNANVSDTVDKVAKDKQEQHPEKSKEEIAKQAVEDPEVVQAIAKQVMEPINIKKDSMSRRDRELREKQKSLKIGNATLEELYEKKAKEVPVPVNDVSGKVKTLNHEITQVQFENFAKEYNEELYDKDIASIAYDLQDKSIPVYIRDVKKEDTSDSLNYKCTYTFHLEDSNRGRHTLKFDVPKFVDGRYMYLNGHKKIFTNQRFLKPLVKTGPDTVQVCTNYNKIFMYRYGDKVESLFEKFKQLVMTDQKNFSYKRGDCSRLNKEYKTTIEYDTLAKQFAEITVKGNPTIHLIFSQPKLKELCDGIGLSKSFKSITDEGKELVAGYMDHGSGSKQRYELFTIDTGESRSNLPVKESLTIPDIVADEFFAKDTSLEESFKTIDWNLSMTENMIYRTAEEYEIEPMELFEPVQEGILSTVWNGIKSLIKGVIKMLLKIWNGLVTMVRVILRKITGFFSSSSKQATSSFVPQEISFITLESATVATREITSSKELQELVVEQIKVISSRIRENSAIQIEDTKRLEHHIETQSEAIQERVVTTGDFDWSGGQKYDSTYHSLPSRDIVSSRQLTHPERFDTKTFSFIARAKNIVEEYNKWIAGDLLRVAEDKNNIKNYQSGKMKEISLLDINIQQALVAAIKQGVPKEDVFAFCRAELYKVPDDPEAIRTLINLRLNYNRRVSTILAEMLKLNYAILGISFEESNKIVERLRNGDETAISKVDEIVNNNREKFTKELLVNGFGKHHYLDFSSIGGGICFYSHADLGMLKPLMVDNISRFFNIALRYDYIIMGHGGKGASREERDELSRRNREYSDLWRKQSDILWPDGHAGKHLKPEEVSPENQLALMEIKKRLTEIEHDAGIGRWTIQPIATKTHSASTDVNEVLRNVIDEAHEEGKERITILLISCNPGHFDLDDDLQKMRDVTIVHATTKMWVD